VIPTSESVREMPAIDAAQLRFLDDPSIVRLYLDDVEEIVRILVDAGKNMKGRPSESGLDPPVKIEYWDDTRPYDEIGEFPKFVQRDYLKIRVTIGDYYQVRFWIDSHSKNLDIRGPNYNEKLAVYDQIQRLLRTRRLYWRTFPQRVSGMVSLLIIFLILLPVVAQWLRHSLPTALAYLISFCLTFYAVVGFVWVCDRGNVVIFRRSFEQAEIRRERQDKFVFEILRLIIAFGLGILSLYLKQKFWP
jgi:hypothetical protein